MNKVSPWIIVSIIPLIALAIGVIHRRNPDNIWQTRREQRQERQDYRKMYERRTIKDFPFNH